MSLQTAELIHSLDKAHLINELQCGQSVNQAVSQNRRADFTLLLAMLSTDARENTICEALPVPDKAENTLRDQFGLNSPQPLSSNQDTYHLGANIAHYFHHGGLPSAKLQHYLAPDALTYQPEATHELDEDVYHNLSGHQRRQLEDQFESPVIASDLYNQLVSNYRQSQIQATI
ncbi:Ribosomal S4P (gammaproteobacterial) [Vibrio aerogenes CECT 7868]|uniref:Ribosomal S4P (Gammaproteobacterial) n=1 Tax=Vibrio aerogenes CECT 7868 TaxID=1216006 RepID=A0A1M6CWI4_9VIBR|nr:VC2046/SO_2500 family protein [Vibrio aerogenes]SHI65435.1 Ribosomal S4P (gammaproteobacterial) [Vibrio aerogenes CECT 7868]